jgi:hypothetical protein
MGQIGSGLESLKSFEPRSHRLCAGFPLESLSRISKGEGRKEPTQQSEVGDADESRISRRKLESLKSLKYE